jgi:hypothetical protein
MTILSCEQFPVPPRGDSMCQTELTKPAETPTHVQSPAKPVSTGYQKARVNVFVNPAQRHQLDALAAEWGVPLTEALRRVLDRGLRGVMHGDSEASTAFPDGAA